MKTVLCPVEVMVRDLFWRIACACAAPTPDVEYLIGQAALINEFAANSKNCVYLGKNVVNTTIPLDISENLLKALDRNQSTVLFLDEEGGIFRSPPSFYPEQLISRHPIDLFGERDRFLLWGNYQAEIIRQRFPQVSDRIEVTGHPRFDIARPRYHSLLPENPQAKSLQPYVLFNTSFSLTNNLRNLGEILRMETIQYDQCDEMHDYLVEMWSWEKANQGLFVHVLTQFAKAKPDTNIVLRPHPVEDPSLYEALVGNFPNVHIIKNNDQTALEWIVHADAVVHSSCTTGLEASLADRPVIALNMMPEGGDKTPVAVAFEKLGNSCHSQAQDAVDALLQIKDEGFTGDLSPISAELHNVTGQEAISPLDLLVKQALNQLPGDSIVEQFPHLPSSPIKRMQAKKQRRRTLRKVGRYINFKFTPWTEEWITQKILAVADIMGTSVDITVESPILVRIRGK